MSPYRENGQSNEPSRGRTTTAITAFAVIVLALGMAIGTIVEAFRRPVIYIDRACPPSPTETAIRAACDNACDALGMQNISYGAADGSGFFCSCAEPGRACVWWSRPELGHSLACESTTGTAE